MTDENTHRVTPSEVTTIFFTEMDAPELRTWIAVAHELVDEHLVGQGVSDGVLKQVEKLLSAHFASINDPVSEGGMIGNASFDYQGDTGMYLDATRYGQAAKAVDPTGQLKAAEDGGNPDARMITL